MSRTRVRGRRIALTLSIAAIAAAWAGPVLGSGAGAAQVARRTYVVRGGDTLWSIARAVSPTADPRPLVDAISEANGVDSGAIAPGQTLVIPEAF